MTRGFLGLADSESVSEPESVGEQIASSISVRNVLHSNRWAGQSNSMITGSVINELFVRLSTARSLAVVVAGVFGLSTRPMPALPFFYYAVTILVHHDWPV